MTNDDFGPNYTPHEPKLRESSAIEYTLYSNFFHRSRLLCLPWKNRVALKFFTVLNTLFTFRSFEQLALALKNRVALEFFTVLNMYFLSFRSFEQIALVLKIFKPEGAAALPPRTPMHIGNMAMTNSVAILDTARERIGFSTTGFC